MSSTQRFDWPEYFPKDCPKEPHTCPSGQYIRLVSRTPSPPDSDFLPQITDAANVSRREGRGSICRSCALSIFDSVESATAFRDNQGENFRHHFLALMEVLPHDGVIHPDDQVYRGHCLWWIPKGPDGRSFKRFFRGCIDGT